MQARLGSSVIIEHPCRRYVSEGEVWQLLDGGEWALRRAVLFNDMLLLTKDKGGKADPSERLSYKSHLNFFRTTPANH